MCSCFYLLTGNRKRRITNLTEFQVNQYYLINEYASKLLRIFIIIKLYNKIIIICSSHQISNGLQKGVKKYVTIVIRNKEPVMCH